MPAPPPPRLTWVGDIGQQQGLDKPCALRVYPSTAHPTDARSSFVSGFAQWKIHWHLPCLSWSGSGAIAAIAARQLAGLTEEGLKSLVEAAQQQVGQRG